MRAKDSMLARLHVDKPREVMRHISCQHAVLSPLKGSDKGCTQPEWRGANARLINELLPPVCQDAFKAPK